MASRPGGGTAPLRPPTFGAQCRWIISYDSHGRGTRHGRDVRNHNESRHRRNRQRRPWRAGVAGWRNTVAVAASGMIVGWTTAPTNVSSDDACTCGGPGCAYLLNRQKDHRIG